MLQSGDHGVLGVTHAAVDLVHDFIHVNPGLGTVEKLRLVLLLCHKVGELDAGFLVAVFEQLILDYGID